MTVRVSKPVFNVREKLSELDIPVGSHGTQLMKSADAAESFDLVGAGRKNRIINGSMKVAQRSTSVAVTGYGYHTLDRFHTVANSSMTYAVTMSQQSDNPDGMGKSVKLLTTTAKTPSGSENYILRYKGEEQDITAAGYGTSKSKSVTVSFSVKSNKTGTYGFQMYLGGFNPSTTFAYTINKKDTWERKTITIPSYTTSYSHGADNGVGFTLDWNLSSGPDDILAPFAWQSATTAARGVTGQVNMLDTVNNYFQLTNVQLEIGPVATSFEHRSYAEELALCKRYYERYTASGGNTGRGPQVGSYNNTRYFGYINCVSKRHSNVSVGYGGGLKVEAINLGSDSAVTGISDYSQIDGGSGIFLEVNTSAWGSGGTLYHLGFPTNAYISIDSEM